MFEGICIIAGVILVFWALRRSNKKGKPKANHAPPVRSPRDPASENLLKLRDQKEAVHNHTYTSIFDDLLSAAEEITDAIISKKRSSSSDRHASSDSSFDSWGGDD